MKPLARVAAELLAFIYMRRLFFRTHTIASITRSPADRHMCANKRIRATRLLMCDFTRDKSATICGSRLFTAYVHSLLTVLSAREQ